MKHALNGRFRFLVAASLSALVWPALLSLKPTAGVEASRPVVEEPDAQDAVPRSPNVTGRVTANGRPVLEAFIVSNVPMGFVMTDQEGRFEIRSDTTGECSIHATNALLGSTRARQVFIPEAGSTHVELEFEDFGKLSGVVTGRDPALTRRATESSSSSTTRPGARLSF